MQVGIMRKAKAMAMKKIAAATGKSTPPPLPSSSLPSLTDSEEPKSPPSFLPVALLKSPVRTSLRAQLHTSPAVQATERFLSCGVNPEKDVVFCNRGGAVFKVNRTYRSLVDLHWSEYTDKTPKNKKQDFIWKNIVTPIAEASGSFWIWEREDWETGEAKKLSLTDENHIHVIVKSVQQALRDKKKAAIKINNKRKAEQEATNNSKNSKKIKVSPVVQATSSKNSTKKIKIDHAVQALLSTSTTSTMCTSSMGTGDGAVSSVTATATATASLLPASLGPTAVGLNWSMAASSNSSAMMMSMMYPSNGMMATTNNYWGPWRMQNQYPLWQQSTTTAPGTATGTGSSFAPGIAIATAPGTATATTPTERTEQAGFIAIQEEEDTKASSVGMVTDASSTSEDNDEDSEATSVVEEPEPVPLPPNNQDHQDLHASGDMDPIALANNNDQDDLMDVSELMARPHRPFDIGGGDDWNGLSQGFFCVESVRDRMNEQVERITAAGYIASDDDDDYREEESHDLPFSVESVQAKMNDQVERASTSGCTGYLSRAGDALSEESLWSVPGIGDDSAVQSDLDFNAGEALEVPNQEDMASQETNDDTVGATIVEDQMEVNDEETATAEGTVADPRATINLGPNLYRPSARTMGFLLTNEDFEDMTIYMA